MKRPALHPRDRLRVVSWNMGMGPSRGHAPGQHDQAWHYLLGLGPDLAFVQEALPPAWVRGEGTLVHGVFRQWGSAIFAPRLPAERFELAPGSSLRSLGSYLAFAQVSLPDGVECLAASVHTPARPATPAHLGGRKPADLARSAEGPRINDAVFAGLAELAAGRPFIAAGDWNTGRTMASKIGREAGEAFFARVKEHGWYDCVWENLGDETQTWFREGDVLKQNDHVFCDESLGRQLRNVWTAPDAAEVLGLSDHAPLVLDFEIPSIAMTNLSDGAAPEP